MKRTFSALSFVWIVTSCQPYGDSLPDDTTAQETTSDPSLSALVTHRAEEWELVREISAWSPRVIDYDTMSRKTYYRFRPNQMFYKYTTHGDTVQGNYTARRPRAEGQPLVINLTFPENYFFYNGCLSGQERFELRADTLVNNAQACDRPKLLYVKR